MTWYAAFNIATGELVSTGDYIEPAKVPAGLKLVELSAHPDFAYHAWHAPTQTFVQRADVQASVNEPIPVPGKAVILP